MTTPDETGQFGALLRRFRLAAGLSQEQLAERAGLSRRGISDLERGARGRPYPNTVRRLAEALDLDGTARAQLQAVRASKTGWLSSGRPLPVPLSSFVGRQHELSDVRRLLETARLLTLTGAGGIGKTRLALEVARALDQEASSLQVALVELAALNDPAMVPSNIARALGVLEQPARPLLDTLADAVGARRLLLVLDNCEHLVEACAKTAEMLVRGCAALRILATSRQPLGVLGEVVWRVPSLALPWPSRATTIAEVGRSEAARLFIERAQAALPGFTATVQNAPAIAQICHRLDGIPLAIELAAARIPALGVEQIAARLDDRLRLLAGRSRTGLPRQQTLRGTLDWSYHLLDESERILFRRLAVFSGGWTLEAAEAVCASEAPDLQREDVPELLVELVDKSLVVAEDLGGEMRYRLLETTRQYALEKLGSAGEDARVRRRHLYWFRGLAERARSAPPWTTANSVAEPVEPRIRQSSGCAGLDPDGERVVRRWSAACSGPTLLLDHPWVRERGSPTPGAGDQPGRGG